MLCLHAAVLIGVVSRSFGASVAPIPAKASGAAPSNVALLTPSAPSDAFFWAQDCFPDPESERDALASADPNRVHEAAFAHDPSSRVPSLLVDAAAAPVALFDDICLHIIEHTPMNAEQEILIDGLRRDPSMGRRRIGADPFAQPDFVLLPPGRRLCSDDLPVVAALYQMLYGRGLPPVRRPPVHCRPTRYGALRASLQAMLWAFHADCARDPNRFRDRFTYLRRDRFVAVPRAAPSQSLGATIGAVLDAHSAEAVPASVRRALSDRISAHMETMPMTTSQRQQLILIRASEAVTRRRHGLDPFPTSASFARLFPQPLNGAKIHLIGAVYRVLFGADLPPLTASPSQITTDLELSVSAALCCYAAHCHLSKALFRARHPNVPLRTFYPGRCAFQRLCPQDRDSSRLLPIQVPGADALCARTVARFGRSPAHQTCMTQVGAMEATRLRDRGLDPFADRSVPLLPPHLDMLLPEDLSLVADLYGHFFGAARTYHSSLCRRTRRIQRSLIAMLICYWEHCHDDMDLYRDLHPSLPVVTFVEQNCAGGAVCNAVEKVAWRQKRRLQTQIRMRATRQRKSAS